MCSDWRVYDHTYYYPLPVAARLLKQDLLFCEVAVGLLWYSLRLIYTWDTLLFLAPPLLPDHKVFLFSIAVLCRSDGLMTLTPICTLPCGYIGCVFYDPILTIYAMLGPVDLYVRSTVRIHNFP